MVRVVEYTLAAMPPMTAGLLAFSPIASYVASRMCCMGTCAKEAASGKTSKHPRSIVSRSDLEALIHDD
jgi:hypothetical protein